MLKRKVVGNTGDGLQKSDCLRAGRHDEGIEAASAYLRDNLTFRRALGIPPDAVLVPHPLGMGEHNLNYWFDDPATGKRLVLRINVTKQPFHANQVRYEYDTLTALEPSGCTPLPLFLDDSPEAPGEGALVISFCEGEELDFDDLQPGDLACVAHLMADVHSVHVEEGCPLFRPENPLRELFEECLRRYRLYLGSAEADPRVERWMDAFAARCERAVEDYRFDREHAHIVNSEPLPSHFLIPHRSGGSSCNEAAQDESGASRDGGHTLPSGSGASPTGGHFIDWERPTISDVAEDVAFFVSPTTTFWDSELLLPPSDAEAFVEKYWRAVDGRIAREGFDERFAAFRKVVAFRAFSWCCRYQVLVAQNPKMHHTGKAAQKVPVYLSEDFLEYAARECFGM